MPIKENIRYLRNNIPKDVQILAATKTRNIEQIKEAVNSGIKIFGENYVQEAEKKYTTLKKSKKIELYFIGHLQKNKINRASKIFDLLTIDSFEIASEINKRTNKKIKILIEVNISNEPQKHGCKPQQLINLIKKLSTLKNIEVLGLMAMAPYFKNTEKTRLHRRTTHKLHAPTRLQHGRSKRSHPRNHSPTTTKKEKQTLALDTYRSSHPHRTRSSRILHPIHHART